MPFSWKSLLLAPLAVPFVCTALLTMSSSGKNPVAGFLLLFAIGGVISYGVTIFLFLPALFAVSRFTRLNAVKTALVGIVLGAFVYIPAIWQSWKSSGADSGPPATTFAEYFRQHASGSESEF